MAIEVGCRDPINKESEPRVPKIRLDLPCYHAAPYLITKYPAATPVQTSNPSMGKGQVESTGRGTIHRPVATALAAENGLTFGQQTTFCAAKPRSVPLKVDRQPNGTIFETEKSTGFRTRRVDVAELACWGLRRVW